MSSDVVISSTFRPNLPLWCTASHFYLPSDRRRSDRAISDAPDKLSRQREYPAGSLLGSPYPQTSGVAQSNIHNPEPVMQPVLPS